jgi:hypothetical protein
MFSLIGRGRLLIPLFLLVFSGLASPAFGLNFNAYWLYRERGGEGVDTKREFQQAYKTGSSPTLVYQPTQAISARFFLDYSRTQQNLGQDQGWVTTDRLTPSGQIAVTNDIFTAQLGGFVTKTHTSGSAVEPTTTSWDATLASAWQIPLWPSVTLNYGERTDKSKNSNGETISNIKDTNTGVALNWDLILAQFNYQFTHSESEDQVNGGLQKSDTHFARLENGGQFLQKRVSYHLAQQGQYSTGDVSLGTGAGGAFDEKLQGGQSLSAVTDPVNGPPPEDVVLSDNPKLSDGDFRAEALNVDSSLRVQLGVSFSLPQQIDIMKIFFDPLTAPTEDQALTLKWDLYIRNPFDTGWELAATNIPATFDAGEKRLELTIDRNENEIMVVATNTIGIPLSITEMEVFRRLTQDITTRTINYLGNLNTSVRLSRTVTASSSLSYERFNIQANGNDIVSDRYSISGRLSWNPTPFLTPSLGFNQNRQNQTGEADQLNRSYSLIVSSLPLPTLNVTFGATRIERYLGDEKTQTSNNFNLSTAAQVYPDLSSALYLSYNNAQILDSERELTSADSYSARWTLNARINRALTSDLTNNYFHSENRSGVSSSSDSTLTMLYRPSPYLSLSATGTKFWTGAGGTDSLAMSLNLWLLRTEKTQLNFRYNLVQADSSTNNFNLDWSWTISQHLYLQTKFNYTSAQTDIYFIESLLSFRL